MRLRPYTMVLPKPLIPLDDQPILEHIIRRLAAAGVGRVDLCLGRHLGGLIENYFSHATTLPEGLEIVYHWEEEPLGTAGPLREIADLDERFIVLNGDILTTLDYRKLFDAHVASGAALTIAMHRETVDVSLGVIDSVDGQVLGYREKPRLTYDVSMGVYVYERRALDFLPENGAFQFPDVVTRLLNAGEVVCPYRSDAVWYDIGTFAEYERALTDLSEHPELFATVRPDARPNKGDYVWRQDEIRLDRRHAGPGYRHALTIGQLRKYIALLPDWDEVAVGLDAIVLDAGHPEWMGWYNEGVVALCAWPAHSGFWYEADPAWITTNAFLLSLLDVKTEQIDGRTGLLWTEQQARAFMLLDVLPHELGHHRDVMTARSGRRPTRGEPFAEHYARQVLNTVWPVYGRHFDL